MQARPVVTLLLALCCFLALRYAYAIVWTSNPDPGGTVQSGAEKGEGLNLTYRITAQDRDSWSATGAPDDPVSIAGDGLVILRQEYQGNPPSGGTFISMVQAGYDEVAGTRTYDITVRVDLIPARQPVTRIDPYSAGDSRQAGDPRWDHTLAGQSLRVPLNQTVTITHRKSEATGRVVDVQTGLPIAGADVYVYGTEQDADNWLVVAGTDFDGYYDAYDCTAGPIQIDVSVYGGAYLGQGRSATAPLGGVVNENFALEPVS